MSIIINFPLMKQLDQPQDDIDGLEMISNCIEHYFSKDKCYKCGETFIEDEHIWFINQMAGYHSQLDGSSVDVQICDKCLINFLGVKL